MLFTQCVARPAWDGLTAIHHFATTGLLRLMEAGSGKLHKSSSTVGLKRSTGTAKKKLGKKAVLYFVILHLLEYWWWQALHQKCPPVAAATYIKPVTFVLAKVVGY